MARKARGIYRRCQECSVVNQANAFKRAPKATLVGPERVVVCPSCGYQAPGWAFPQIEPPAEQEGQD